MFIKLVVVVGRRVSPKTSIEEFSTPASLILKVKNSWNLGQLSLSLSQFVLDTTHSKAFNMVFRHFVFLS